MINDRIIWPKHYDPAKADINVEAEATAEGITAEELWPYLTNISDIQKLVHEVVDAEPLDPNTDDPHLYPKEEFSIDTTEFTAHFRVLEAIPPKGDRVGRITWDGEATPKQGGKPMRIIHAWVLEVEKGEKLNVLSAFSVTGNAVSADYFDAFNRKWVNALVKYTIGKETHTNHPRHPSSGAMVK